MPQIGKSCQSCDKRSISLFCDLPPEALKIIDSHKSVNRYKKGQFVFYTGNNPVGLYCISGGTVRLEVDGPMGKGHILRLVKAGDVLGYRSLFAEETYSASAIAHEDCEICLISKEGIQQLLREFPEIGFKMLKQVSQELRKSEARFCSMTDKNASERVAESLLYFKERFAEQSWTRKEIADFAGTTPETVIRTLTEFEKNGLIRQQGRKITITKRDDLAEIAQFID